jgi:hypothetical protein
MPEKDTRLASLLRPRSQVAKSGALMGLESSSSVTTMTASAAAAQERVRERGLRRGEALLVARAHDALVDHRREHVLGVGGARGDVGDAFRALEAPGLGGVVHVCGDHAELVVEAELRELGHEGLEVGLHLAHGRRHRAGVVDDPEHVDALEGRLLKGLLVGGVFSAGALGLHRGRRLVGVVGGDDQLHREGLGRERREGDLHRGRRAGLKGGDRALEREVGGARAVEGELADV